MKNGPDSKSGWQNWWKQNMDIQDTMLILKVDVVVWLRSVNATNWFSKCEHMVLIIKNYTSDCHLWKPRQLCWIISKPELQSTKWERNMFKGTAIINIQEYPCWLLFKVIKRSTKNIFNQSHLLWLPSSFQGTDGLFLFLRMLWNKYYPARSLGYSQLLPLQT